jgi:hypothetical protein
VRRKRGGGRFLDLPDRTEEFERRGPELIRAGFALLGACYVTEDPDLYADLMEQWDLEEREEAWSLVAGLLVGYLADHGEGLGCRCGDAAWLERVLLGEAAHD